MQMLRKCCDITAAWLPFCERMNDNTTRSFQESFEGKKKKKQK